MRKLLPPPQFSLDFIVFSPKFQKVTFYDPISCEINTDPPRFFSISKSGFLALYAFMVGCLICKITRNQNIEDYSIQIKLLVFL